VRSASSPHEAATLLTNSAFVAGSLDNLTAVVVALRGYKNNATVASSVAEPFWTASRPFVGWEHNFLECVNRLTVTHVDADPDRRPCLLEAPWLDPCAAHHVCAF